MKEDADLRKFLNLSQSNGEQPVTHVVVSAPWVKTASYSQLCSMFPLIHFAMNCHSNVGFLQADTNGVKLLREGLDLEVGTFNFHVAGNSKKFCRFIEDAYSNPCQYLPNLYYLNHLTNPFRHSWCTTGGVLRIGIFGATRALKNFISALGAAIEISHDLKAHTKVFVSTEREDGPDTKRILAVAREMTRNLPLVKLVEVPWTSWPQFRKIVGSMHLLLQPSYTESFNIVTADGVAEGVPAVVSDAVVWAPQHWKAEVDDVFSIARAGVRVLHDPHAAKEGLRALVHHNEEGLREWTEYLTKRMHQ